MISIQSADLVYPGDPATIRRGRESWLDAAGNAGDARIQRFATDALTDPDTGRLLDMVFSYSPYLTQELVRDQPFARDIIETSPEQALERTLAVLIATPVEALSTPALMALLRRAKRRAALAIGLADIAGGWTVEAVTQALTRVAETALRLAVRHLLAAPAFARLPGNGGGLIVLGMGKLGAYELNYSSDIDLIVFYDDALLGAHPAESGADGSGFVRLTRALIRIMEEKTGDGYVFRTDLRLRPDPASTPLAVSLSAVEMYYGSLGQNWERAAMIKARQVAGDPTAGESLFAMLRPWIWRRNLDFAAIEDIHSIKRQIDRRKLKPASAALLGHNIKLGLGGIREIEFYTQTQQLIFGGRDPSLRAPGTCDALRALAAARRIADAAADELIQAYRFLRRVEHRLQMVDDRQTHTLPETPEGMERMAGFLGYPDAASFTAALTGQLEIVQARFAALFARSPSLSGPGSLVFTGVDDDPGTLATLTELGFGNPRGVAGVIRGWHHGRYRATRSERARELLTKLTPDLLTALSETADPGAAFLRFDAFLAAQPASVTLLSLFAENRQLLKLTGRIFGMAPALAAEVALTPALFDELLERDFFAKLPEQPALARDLDRSLGLARDYEDSLVRLRRWVAGRKFQAGVHILEAISDGIVAGRFLGRVANVALARLLPLVEAEFALRHGRITGGGFAVVALGRLGGGVMSFTSDLDLVAIYDAPEGAISDGAKPLDRSLYYIRLTQRLIAAITAPMAGGRLYPVDLRLRPSGESGPVAVGLESFRQYHASNAWTWEHMALTRARVVAGPAALSHAIAAVIRDTLTAPRDQARLVKDVAAMRRRIAAQYPPRDRWDLKYADGGLIDIEFTVQYLLLRHGHDDPGLLVPDTAAAIAGMARSGHLSAEAARDLDCALELAWRVQGLIRLTTGGALDREAAPGAIKAMLAAEVARATGGDGPGDTVDFAQAETILDDMLAASHARFVEIVARAAASIASPTA